MRRLVPLVLLVAACAKSHVETPSAPRPSILLVTLDTTRADAVGPEQANVDTPSFNALAARGRRFRYAYCAVPQTLASHGSMMTGLYPAGHGVHENGRYFSDRVPMLAERLKGAGYSTAAFVSAFALARRFGLARGFDVYDDDFGPEREQRPANETTDRAMAWLAKPSPQPRFVWVHYYDPHYPYTPPAPFAARYPKQPYFGEVAFMDQQLGRLVQAFGAGAIIVVADHGEGLGDHGEQQHGNLLYQQTMHVPLLVIGPGATPGMVDAPVSTRRVFDTVLGWAGVAAANGLLRSAGVPPAPAGRLARRQAEDAGAGRAVGAGGTPALHDEVVVAEAMKPFLDYGWQPQVMAVEGRLKTISAGKTEVYDVVADPAEAHDLAGRVDISRSVRAALQEYPVPTATEAAAPASAANDEERRKLASLGYVAATTKPIVRQDAPRPADMTALFPILDKASGLFVRGQYAECIPLFQRVVAADPYNLDARLHLATAHSTLGHDKEALDAYTRAQAVAPDSPDVRAYLGLHYARGKEWQKAVPLLERVVADDPSRLPALEGLATVRERQGRVDEAVRLWQKVYTMRTPSDAELAHLGAMAMAAGDTTTAITAFEKTRGHDLELGVLYLAARRFDDARAALDRVPPTHSEYPMALFKRAQVSVLLHETDAPARIETARARATPLTRELIARERLFRER
jgi:arylsulfatase A-like enzyme/Flp pilus assembly protein TadD